MATILTLIIKYMFIKKKKKKLKYQIESYAIWFNIKCRPTELFSIPIKKNYYI